MILKESRILIIKFMIYVALTVTRGDHILAKVKDEIDLGLLFCPPEVNI